ncbi:MAG TPA: copper resistance protein B [Gemmatimonadetes bacterium]|nr:copper resistance protein B [Gemmatimonadota bacterium]
MKVRTRSGMLALTSVFMLVAPAAPVELAGQELENGIFHFSLVDVDASRTSDATIGRWDGSGWIGTDFDRFWWNTSGAAEDGGLDEAEVMLLYGHYARRFWDVVVGYRHEIEPTSQGYLTFGVMGLAPYWFEVGLFGFVSDRGKPGLRFEGENDMYLTQRWVLQLATEFDWLITDDDELDLAAGFRRVEVGLRTRYEIRRKLAPYVDLTWSSEKTRRVPVPGEVDVDGVRLGVGVRLIY